MNIFYTDQIDGEYDQGNDPQCQVYDLGFQAEHQKKKDQRNYKNQDKTGTDQLWIPFFEPVGTLDKISPSVFVLHHGFHHQCKLWAGELTGCSLSQHQVCLGKTFVEQMVQIHQKWSQYQSDEECKEKEKQQGQQILCVVIFVKSGNTLTHSANSVRERQKRMQSLEKDRCHLDRIGSGRTRDLQDDQDNGKRFSNVLEGQRHCIDQIDIHKGAEHTSAHKCNRVDTLYFQKQQISYAHKNPWISPTTTKSIQRPK